MPWRAKAFLVVISKAFRRAGTHHVVVIVASLIGWTLCASLKQSWLLDKRGAIALTATTREASSARGVVLTTFTDALSIKFYERSGTGASCTVVVSKFVCRAQLTDFWIPGRVGKYRSAIAQLALSNLLVS